MWPFDKVFRPSEDTPDNKTKRHRCKMEPVDEDAKPEIPDGDYAFRGHPVLVKEDDDYYIQGNLYGEVPGECVECGEEGTAHKRVEIKFRPDEVTY